MVIKLPLLSALNLLLSEALALDASIPVLPWRTVNNSSDIWAVPDSLTPADEAPDVTVDVIVSAAPTANPVTLKATGGGYSPTLPKTERPALYLCPNPSIEPAFVVVIPVIVPLLSSVRLKVGWV